MAFLEGSYEDALKVNGAKGHRQLIEDWSPYDAVLLGWTSFTHIVVDEYRQTLLQLARHLCPTGPVLLSFFMADSMTIEKSSRAARLGARFGTLVSKSHPRQPEYGWNIVRSHFGFAHFFTHDEIVALADGAGYNADIRMTEPDASSGYPHATLLPRDAD